jgi:hypothetical protein
MGWWIVGGVVVLGMVLGAARAGNGGGGAQGGALLVQVDERRLVNMAQVREVIFSPAGHNGPWHFLVYFAGENDPETLTYQDEKQAQEVWARLTAQAVTHP